jgi:hypothetical protein
LPISGFRAIVSLSFLSDWLMGRTLVEVIDQCLAGHPSGVANNCIRQSFVQEFVPEPLGDTQPRKQLGFAVRLVSINDAFRGSFRR